jgi:hypothetical protein
MSREGEKFRRRETKDKAEAQRGMRDVISNWRRGKGHIALLCGDPFVPGGAGDFGDDLFSDFVRGLGIGYEDC